MKKDKIRFNEIIQKEVNGYKKYLLFKRKFYGQEYKFFLAVDISWCDDSTNSTIRHYVIETPPNCFGYTDTIMFQGGIGYSLDRYHTPYIYKECRKALLKRGYRGGGLENKYTDFSVYFAENAEK